MNRKYRIMSLLALLLVVGFLFTSIISYYVAQRSMTEQIAGNTLPLTSDNIYSEIQQDLLRPIFISSLMAHDTFVRDWVVNGEQKPEQMTRYLREIQKRYGTVTSFFVSDLTHNYYHSDGILKVVQSNDPQDQWYFSMPGVLNDYQINVDQDTADITSMTVFINHKVYNYKGDYIGTIGVGLAVNSVKELIETYQQRYGRTIFFTDRQGVVTLVGSDYVGPMDIRGVNGLTPYVTQILTAPSTSLSYSNNNHKTYFSSRLVEDFNWYLIVIENESMGEQRIQKTMLINIGISLIVTLLVLTIAGLTIGGYQKKLETMATTDQLTGLTSRQMFSVFYNQVFKANQRRKSAMSLIMIDIDHFKKINDTYGHPGEDHVLQGVANALKGILRGDEHLFRWGGEEFLVLLSDCDIDQALKSAERFRSRVEALVMYQGAHIIKVTISLGAAQIREGESIDNLISRADDALYQAKHNGRNRTEQI